MKVWGLVFCVVLAAVACVQAAPGEAVVSAPTPVSPPADDAAGATRSFGTTNGAGVATPFDVVMLSGCNASNNAWCDRFCGQNGFGFWQCIPPDTCRCTNTPLAARG